MFIQLSLKSNVIIISDLINRKWSNSILSSSLTLLFLKPGITLQGFKTQLNGILMSNLQRFPNKQTKWSDQSMTLSQYSMEINQISSIRWLDMSNTRRYNLKGRIQWFGLQIRFCLGKKGKELRLSIEQILDYDISSDYLHHSLKVG